MNFAQIVDAGEPATVWGFLFCCSCISTLPLSWLILQCSTLSSSLLLRSVHTRRVETQGIQRRRSPPNWWCKAVVICPSFSECLCHRGKTAVMQIPWSWLSNRRTALYNVTRTYAHPYKGIENEVMFASSPWKHLWMPKESASHPALRDTSFVCYMCC